jgi:hypothetical protein
MMNEPLFVSCNISLTAGQTQDIYFFPYKMSELEVFNNGPNNVVAMVNGAGLPNGITVYAQGSRVFTASKRAFTRIGFYCPTGSASITVNATR